MNNYRNYYNYSNLDPYKGFLRGNLFDNLYVPYKNYKFREINPTNEREYDMLMLQMYGFDVHDLDLYLDVYPDDSEAIKIRKQYFDKYMAAKANYENKYGPISLSSNLLDNNPWLWDTKVWPWEGNK